MQQNTGDVPVVPVQPPRQTLPLYSRLDAAPQEAFASASDPIRAVAAHRGHGNVLIKVFSQPPQNFSCYEVQIATDAAGPYSSYNNFQFFTDVGVLVDVPLEITIYMRIRYMTTLNGVNTFSEWFQVRRGILSTPSVIMQVRTIRDSRIAKGSAFPCEFRGMGLIAFKSPTELIIR